MKQHYLVFYDIADDRRRRRLVAWLECIGAERLQFSVFLLASHTLQRDEIQQRVVDIINLQDDSVIISKTCKSCLANSTLANAENNTHVLQDSPRELLAYGYTIL